MPDRSLTEALHDLVDADKIRLPAHPAIVAHVLDQSIPLENLEQIKCLCASDPALACHLFRAANSSFFMGLNQTRSFDQAITRLGQDQARDVLRQVCLTNQTGERDALTRRYLPPLWQHAVGCAIGAEWLADRCGYQGLAQEAYLAGLLHDIGKLFLLASLQEIAACDHSTLPLSDQIIHEVMATMHVEQGLRLAAAWNLPEDFANVISRHHEATQGNQNITLALVKLANKGCCKIGLGWKQDRTLVLPTTAEAQFLGIDEIALAEYEIMLEDRFFDADYPIGRCRDKEMDYTVSS